MTFECHCGESISDETAKEVHQLTHAVYELIKVIKGKQKKK